MKEINKTAVINIISVVLLQGISFFTTPVFARMLGNDQYGKYSIYISWMTIFSAIMGFGVGNALAVGKYDYKEKYYYFRSSILLLGNLISFSVIILGIIMRHLLEYGMAQPFPVVLLMLCSAMSNYNISVAQGALIYEKKPQLNFSLSLSYTVLNVGLSLFLVFVVPYSERYLARIFGFSLSQILVAAVVWLFMYCRQPAGLSYEYSKYAIAYGMPTVFHTLSYSVLIQSDRIMMQHMGITDADVGIYSLFYSFASMLSVILSALNNTWCPFFFDDLEADNRNALIAKTRNYIELFTVLTAGFILLSRDVGYWFAGDGYVVGLDLIPILVLAIYLTFMYQFPVNFEFFHKKTKIVAIGTVCAAYINIMLNFFLIDVWGFYGAAIATMLSYLMLFILHYVIVNRYMEFKYYLGVKLFIPGLVVICLISIIYYVLKDALYLRWSLGIFIGILEIYRIKKRKKIF